MAFGEVLFDEHAVSPKQLYLFNGKELDFETGLYYYGARYYDPRTSIFLNVDPLVEKTRTLYAYTYNNPINLIDPTGMEAESVDGDYYDSKGKYLGNDGKNDNKVYQLKRNYRARFENKNINWGGTLDEQHYKELQGKSNDLGIAKIGLTFTGEANPNNLKQADGQLNIIQIVENKEFVRESFDAVGGPWGNGSPENGNYIVNNLLDRGPKGWYNEGMTKDGVGFSLDLIPQFKTGRTLLRIHPDGGKFFGTQGCVGLTCNKDGLLEFRQIMQNALSNQKSIPLNINILNNPNNNGYGKKVKSNGE